MTDDAQAGQIRWSSLLRTAFGASFWAFVVLAFVMAGVCYAVLGPEAFASAIGSDKERLADLIPRVAAAQIVAGFVWVLLPRDRLSGFLKRNRGQRGLLLAAAAGVITPGGPASAYPFLAILAGTGADRGILVAYISSWALLGMQRIIIWDIPLMGMDFSVVRFLISLPLPIIAGMLARRLPIGIAFATSSPHKDPHE